jgi:transposase
VVEVLLSGGNAHDMTMAKELVADVFGCAVLADTGYVGKGFRAFLVSQNNTPHIPSRGNTISPEPYDKDLYKLRRIIEMTFGKLKENKRLDTRFDKLDATLLGSLAIAFLKITLGITLC